jgi:hypothetical protein
MAESMVETDGGMDTGIFYRVRKTASTEPA